MHKVFPILKWLPKYKSSYLKNDLIAGITVAVLLIPQGMAYAMLAGLPPIAGLYAALIPLITYTIFGSSRHLSVGPVAIDSLLVASGVGMIAHTGTEHFIMLAGLTAILVGIIQYTVGTLRLGFTVNFLSTPVISGFTSAAALIIATSQLKHILGLSIPLSTYIYTNLSNIIQNFSMINSSTLILGLSSIFFLVTIKKYLPAVPGALAVVILSTVTVWFFDLDQHGILIVGDVPGGLPTFTIPEFDPTIIQQLIPISLTIGLMSFMEAIAVGKKFAAKHNYTIDANLELKSVGLSNVSSGLFGGYPMAGSFSRTAVNSESGAKTQVSSLVNALIIALTLLFLTPLFYYMPTAVLAAIIIVAVSGLFDLNEPKRLYKVKKSDFYVLLFSFLATLFLGVQYGIFVGIAASLVMILRRISNPHIAKMGQVPGTETLRNFDRDKHAEEIEGLFIFRIDASLYFANVAFLKDLIETNTLSCERKIKAVIFDASSVNEIDSSADTGLHDIADTLKKRGIELYLTNVKGPVRDMLKLSGFQEKLGKDHFFLNKKEAVQHYIEELKDC
ncbi:MAG: solute carrier 26 family protein [Calditrichaeota bacterium]|nr:MAG: solute carrier 26 family protein [Calditrichota bacterium]MBL1207928.1 solute carrier 26 family protein [Calditrichota bacterium]NOG47763.1 solute carrier family 26 protein [Calditrichota bacterium]